MALVLACIAGVRGDSNASYFSSSLNVFVLIKNSFNACRPTMYMCTHQRKLTIKYQ